jgi:hypothetical protein
MMADAIKQVLTADLKVSLAQPRRHFAWVGDATFLKSLDLGDFLQAHYKERLSGTPGENLIELATVLRLIFETDTSTRLRAIPLEDLLEKQGTTLQGEAKERWLRALLIFPGVTSENESIWSVFLQREMENGKVDSLEPLKATIVPTPGFIFPNGDLFKRAFQPSLDRRSSREFETLRGSVLRFAPREMITKVLAPFHGVNPLAEKPLLMARFLFPFGEPDLKFIGKGASLANLANATLTWFKENKKRLAIGRCVSRQELDLSQHQDIVLSELFSLLWKEAPSPFLFSLRSEAQEFLLEDLAPIYKLPKDRRPHCRLDGNVRELIGLRSVEDLFVPETAGLWSDIREKVVKINPDLTSFESLKDQFAVPLLKVSRAISRDLKKSMQWWSFSQVLTFQEWLSEQLPLIQAHPKRGDLLKQIQEALIQFPFWKDRDLTPYLKALQELNFSGLKSCLWQPKKGQADSDTLAADLLKRPLESSADATFALFLDSSVCGVYQDLVSPVTLAETVQSEEDVTRMIAFFAEAKVYPGNVLEGALFGLLRRIFTVFEAAKAEKTLTLILDTVDKMADTDVKRQCQIRIAESIFYGPAHPQLSARLESYLKGVTDPAVILTLLRLQDLP